jgi:uncharacterized membrane protein YphA (DoxX/SURF4 family)
MMMKLLSNRILLFAARAVLGMVFIIAAIEKIAVPETFAISVEAYHLVPVELINIFAIVVPWMELLCGIFLVAGVFVRGSAILLSSLLGVFVFAIVSALMRQLKIDCGCFGPAHATPIGWGKVLEDAGLLVLGIYLYLFAATKPAVEDSRADLTGPAEPANG